MDAIASEGNNPASPVARRSGREGNLFHAKARRRKKERAHFRRQPENTAPASPERWIIGDPSRRLRVLRAFA
jgi:hypothetical protein